MTDEMGEDRYFSTTDYAYFSENENEEKEGFVKRNKKKIIAGTAGTAALAAAAYGGYKYRKPIAEKAGVVVEKAKDLIGKKKVVVKAPKK